MRIAADLTGKRFGRYTVIKRAPNGGRPNGGKQVYWYCRCDCGTERAVFGYSLTKDKSVSCGCFQKEYARLLRKTHGESIYAANTAEYRAWLGMKARCFNTTDKSYSSYGGRGIVVCDQWRFSFETFLADMGRRPSPDHSMDRINNNGPYSPDNCRWATRSVQQRNKRDKYDGLKALRLVAAC